MRVEKEQAYFLVQRNFPANNLLTMAPKPRAISTATYNINDLPSDRKFEELMTSIFEARIKDDLKGVFDNVHLMSGVAEQGIDVLLIKNGKNIGAVQCKMSKANLDKSSAAKEIIKFALYYLNDKSLIHDIDTYKYYLAVSNKFSTPTVYLLNDFKNKILQEPELRTWTEEVIKKYKSLKNFLYFNIESEFKEVLSKLNIEHVSYYNIDNWLKKYPHIVSGFFEIQKVVSADNLSESLEIIAKTLSPDLEEKIPKFLNKYYASAKSTLNSVKFIGYAISVNKPQNIKIKELYIEPFFVKKQEKEAGKLDLYKYKDESLSDIFKNDRHLIILGDPGTGKSLTVKKLILQLMDNEGASLGRYSSNIPFRIELRKYNEANKSKPTSLVEYLTNILKNEYQIQGIDENLILYIIETKKTLFFFDGLDEVFDLFDKNQICESIVAFVNVFNNIKCVLTSRFLGYDSSSFSAKLFVEFSIKNFNTQQINEFIDKFYCTQIHDKNIRELSSSDCKSQLINMDEELKSNPLILSLMALLAINHTKIPDSKLKVYESCTNTLVEVRDKDEKNMKFKLKVKSISGTFANLAYWRYCQLTNGGKVSQELSKKVISEYLLEKKEYAYTDEADAAAKDFLSFAEKRSIYFDDNFTHKTFLEYYTADYIFKRLHNTGKYKERDKIIKKYINNFQWHIIFELLISKIDSNLDDNDILDAFFDKHFNPNDRISNFFFLGILPKVENVSNFTVKKIVKNSIRLIISLQDFARSEINNAFMLNDLMNLLVYISNSAKLKLQIQETVFEFENELISESDKVDFYTFFHEFNSSFFREFHNEPLNYNISLAKDEISTLKNKTPNLYFYYSSYPLTKEQIKSFVFCFGAERAFYPINSIYAKGTSHAPVFCTFIIKSKINNIKALQEFIDDIVYFGVTLEVIETVNYDIFRIFMREEIMGEKIEKIIDIYCKSKNINNESIFIKFITKFFWKEALKLTDKYTNNQKFDKILNYSQTK